MRLCRLLMLLGGGLLWLAFNPSWALPVKSSASVEEGFARLSFEWESKVSFKAEIKDNNKLIISFAEEFDGEVKPLVGAISGYLSKAEISEDKKTLTFVLKRPFVLRSYSNKRGRTVVVELLGKAAAVSDKRTTTEATGKSRFDDLGFPQVRYGLHDDFFRLVFDWGEKVEYSIKENNGKPVLWLKAKNFPDYNDAVNAMPITLKEKGLEVVKEDEGYLVYLPQMPIRDFVNRTGVVVDFPLVSPPLSPPVAQDANASPAPRPAPVMVVQTQEIINNAPKTEDDSKPVEEENKTEEVKKEPKAKPEVFMADGGLVENPPEEEIPWPPARVVSLSFPWTSQTAAAVFRRDAYIWVIFDTKKVMDFTPMVRMYGDVIRDIIQVPHSKATVIRILTAPEFNPSVRREGFLWIVDLMKQPMRPQKRIDFVPVEKSAEGPKIFFPVTDAGVLVSIVDTEIGDSIYAVPLFSVGRGVFPERNYVDADFLATAQGIAAITHNDMLWTRTTTTGVEFIAPPDGLKLSSDAEQLAALMRLDDKESLAEPFALNRWYRGGNATANADEFSLKKLVADAPADKKPWAGLEMARYFVANDMPADALGILQNIEDKSPEMAKEGVFLAARGIANFLMHRYPEAVEDLSSEVLAAEDEASFWRAAAEAAIAQPEKQINALKLGSPFIRNYPHHIKTKVSFVGMEAALSAGDDAAAQTFMETAYDIKNSPFLKSGYAYYRGRILEMSGNFLGAVKEYAYAEKSRSRKYAALGAKHRIKLELAIGRIKAEKASKEMDKLRMAWRGDEYEIELLKAIAEIALEAKDYSKALNYYREIVGNFRESPDILGVTKKMKDLFEDIFLGTKAEDLSPIKALALYQDFKELTPGGKRGDEMIRNLSDRLVAVDLLDRAADLLENQVDYRLQGLEKAQVGSRLALIRLMDKKPELALAALDKSEENDIPDAVKTRRKHLRAHALADGGRADEAINLLADDQSDEGIMLRAGIYWNAQRWGEAADNIKLLIKKPEKGVPIDAEQAQRVIDWATALRLAGRDKVILRLRLNFAPFMKETKYWDAFNLLTSGKENGLEDMNDISAQVKEAESFRNFMSDYFGRMKAAEIATPARSNPPTDNAPALETPTPIP